MTRTVDLVVAGGGDAALAAAADALRRGRRLLIVLSGDVSEGRWFRRRLRNGRNATYQFTVITNAEVVCVDGIDGIEAVVIRHRRTGRLSAVNTSAFLACNAR